MITTLSCDYLGFFSTTNKVSPGNYGIKDVQMALVWIQENIDSFNGNPESVTLMGNSAGAGTTHLLALSKKTEGLFHRYILLSGAATAPWNNRPTTAYRQLCLELARRVGCLPQLNDIIVSNETTTEAYVEKFTIEDDEEMMKCMRRIDAREIIRTASTFVSTISDKTIFMCTSVYNELFFFSMFGNTILCVSLVPQ